MSPLKMTLDSPIPLFCNIGTMQFNVLRKGNTSVIEQEENYLKFSYDMLYLHPMDRIIC